MVTVLEALDKGHWAVAARTAPTILVGLHLLHAVSSHLTLPSIVKTVARTVSRPFYNFLTLEDLLDPVDLRPRNPVLQQRLLALLSCTEVAIWAGYAGYAVYTADLTSILVYSLYLGCWVCIGTSLVLQPPSTSPYSLVAFGLAVSLVALFDFAYALFEGTTGPAVLIGAAFFPVHAAFTWVAGSLPLTRYRPGFHVAGSKDYPSSQLTSPEDDVTLWSWCSFTFVEPIMNVAATRTLQDYDVWNLSPFFLHKNIFTKCLEYRFQHREHSLLRFLIVSNSLDLIIDIGLEVYSAVASFVPPYALQEILAALAEGSPEARKTAYLWAAATFVANLSVAQARLIRNWHTRRCYERTRGQLFCALHYKALKREEVSGQVAKGEDEGRAELGKIVNLMQGDSYAVAQRFWDIASLFAAPVRLTIALVFLWNVLGWSGLMGVVVLAVIVLINVPVAKYTIKISRASLKAKDKRMRFVNELLQNIRFLKFYGWEYEWSAKGEKAREEELRLRVKSNMVSIILAFFWQWLPAATALCCFLSYTLLAGHKLTVSKAFTSIALFSSLQGPMILIPAQIIGLLNSYVSMQRIEKFLSEHEVPDWASCLGHTVQRPSESQETGFSEATFEWESATEDSENSQAPRFQLGPLDVKFPTGALTIVSGATGSGKSALLEALLGEMRCVSGKVMIDKSNHQVAYCAQNPWLEHATIKDNIIFGSPAPYDEERYRRVLYACALEPDLEILAAGDMTEIGEKGITLSGGQRARVALARAMYSQAKVILFDDPLAAVDMHTAQHIVQNCFTGDLSAGRTMILVTHHITVCLPVASYLLELEKGHIKHRGTIEELQERGLLKTIIQEEEEPFSEESGANVDEADLSKDARSPAQDTKNSGKLVELEHRAEGQVSLRTYITYLRAAGIHWWVATILLQVILMLVQVATQVFLASWGEAYQEDSSAFVNSLIIVSTPFRYPWDNLPSPNVDVKPWLLVYLYISIAGALISISYLGLNFYASLRASRSLFLALLRRLTRAPLRFFDTTPVGRILNRFTSDMNTIDNNLQYSAQGFISGVITFFISFMTILVIVPSFTPAAIVIAWLYLRSAPPYIRTARDLRRLESVSLSPAFAGFDELLRGITHIRAFGMENRYQDNFYKKVDKFQSFDHVYWLIQGWLGWRYDCLAAVVVFAATSFTLLQGISSGFAAIVMVQAGTFAGANRTLVSVAAQLELDFNSLERVVEYMDVPQEPPAINPKNRPPAYWPSNSGELRVENLVVKYGENLPPVLKNISFTINPGEKIGVIGRTGSGKSTLVLALLRMLEPASGSIIIDGLDISKIGLEDLRTRLTIISQDVSLFSGTIRSNLDPLEKYTTEECEAVLERCHLTSHFAFTPTPSEPTLLDMAVNQNSLSAGEKQLLALARAILRGTNIIIMDEATSQIDMELDDKIQKTIREETAGGIVITIAHRIMTIIDYDRLLVLDDGKVAEMGTPQALLRKPGGVFREICRKSSDWGTLSAFASREASEA
ncbi:pleiotropic drug resistance ABC transporter [Coprinopsis sp. MPI-PUGE-AT-0042]|nr:pleiotropic drug resistance ABC transporter [Coprinopsis sp. MPI-PUGE-AT-0042]